MELWQKISLVVVGVMALFLFLPVASQAMKESPRGSAGDWLGLLFPVGLVVLFVIVLIAMV